MRRGRRPLVGSLSKQTNGRESHVPRSSPDFPANSSDTFRIHKNYGFHHQIKILHCQIQSALKLKK